MPHTQEWRTKGWLLVGQSRARDRRGRHFENRTMYIPYDANEKNKNELWPFYKVAENKTGGLGTHYCKRMRKLYANWDIKTKRKNWRKLRRKKGRNKEIIISRKIVWPTFPKRCEIAPHIIDTDKNEKKTKIIQKKTWKRCEQKRTIRNIRWHRRDAKNYRTWPHSKQWQNWNAAPQPQGHSYKNNAYQPKHQLRHHRRWWGSSW